MAVAAAVVQLAQLGVINVPSRAGLQLGLDVVLFIASVMAGRVIPMFTNGGVPGARAAKHPLIENAALGLVLVLTIVDVIGLHGPVLVALTGAACLVHLVRWTLWQPWKTLRVPLVWILHFAYFWLPVHFALRAFAELGIVSSSEATHALTAGAIGALVIGMMTRTSRGHTARPLRADRVDTTCYVLVCLGGVVRVGAPLLAHQLTLVAVLGSAVLWSAGFGLFAVRYWPVLSRARLDGKPG